MRTRDGLEESRLLPTLHIEFNNSEDHASQSNKIPQYVFSISTLWKSVMGHKRAGKKDFQHGPCFQTVLAQKRRKRKLY